MPEGPLGFERPLGIGPFVKETAPNWREMDSDVLAAPPGWKWDIDDELAHHVWTLTERTREVNYGPDPPILLKSLMGFFDGESKEDHLNNWYFIRIEGESYSDHTDWDKIPAIFAMDRASDARTSILFSEDMRTHPLQSNLQSQQYTADGGMFTYDFSQWQARKPSGFMRIPVVNESLLEDLRERMMSLPFEEFQMQSRVYADQFAKRPPPPGTFFHPHYRPLNEAGQDDFKELYRVAFDIMKRGVRINA